MRGKIRTMAILSAAGTALLAGPPAREVYEVSVQVEITEQGSARVRGHALRSRAHSGERAGQARHSHGAVRKVW